MPKETQSAVCRVCGRKVRTVIPAGGDGSVSVFVRHDGNQYPMLYCPGSRSEAPGPFVAGGKIPEAKKKPDWKEIALAYDEAAEHLEMAAREPIPEEEKVAYLIVAKRIRAAANRVKPN